MGIRAVANLRGVGQNLQDHVLVSGVVYAYKGKMPTAPVDSDAVEAEVFLPSGLSDHPADLCLVLEQLPIADAGGCCALRGSAARRLHESRRRSFSRPVAGACASPAPTGAMLQSSRATTGGPTNDLSAILRRD